MRKPVTDMSSYSDIMVFLKRSNFKEKSQNLNSWQTKKGLNQTITFAVAVIRSRSMGGPWLAVTDLSIFVHGHWRHCMLSESLFFIKDPPPNSKSWYCTTVKKCDTVLPPPHAPPILIVDFQGFESLSLPRTLPWRCPSHGLIRVFGPHSGCIHRQFTWTKNRAQLGKIIDLREMFLNLKTKLKATWPSDYFFQYLEHDHGPGVDSQE